MLVTLFNEGLVGWMILYILNECNSEEISAVVFIRVRGKKGEKNGDFCVHRPKEGGGVELLYVRHEGYLSYGEYLLHYLDLERHVLNLL